MQHETASNDEAEFVRDIKKFAQGFRSLLIPSPEVLSNTAILLRRLVQLSDKVLPVKSYFNMVQQMQRAAFLAEGMAADAVKAEGLTGDRAVMRTQEVIREVEAQGASFWSIAAKDAKFSIKVVGWVQPNPNPGNIAFLSKFRANNVATEMKKLGLKGGYSLNYAGLGKDNEPKMRHATVVIVWNKSKVIDPSA